MSFPPVQGSSAAASRREIPTFGRPRRNPPPENPGNWGHYVPGHAEAPQHPAAPAAASGDWGSGWGGDDRRGRRDRGGPAAHNPFRVQKPDFVRQMVVEEEDETRNSLLVIDNRDDRVVSPFQNWLAQEIMSNAASSINVLTERDQVLTPSSGYHCSLFANYTLDGIKALALLDDLDDGRPLCSMGLPREQGAIAPGLPAVHLAGHVRYFGHLCGRQGLQWK